MTAAPATKFITQTATCSAPLTARGRFGNYGRVAVLEIEANYAHVTMISPRARGVVRVVQTWEQCYVGRTDRCAFALAVDAAETLASALNSELSQI